MFEFFRHTEKFEPIVIAAFENDNLCGILMGVFIHETKGLFKLLSSRVVIYGGPLISEETSHKQHCLDELLKALIQKTRHKALFIQFRNFFSQEDLISVYTKNNFYLIDRLNYIVHIPDKESVLKKMSKSRRRQVRKALKSGAEIIDPESIDQIKSFYNILYQLYRYKVRKPLPDWLFFKQFYYSSEAGKLGIIKLIRYEDKIIGGILAPVFKHNAIYEWYICGLDREYKDQYPSVLATWAGIKYALDHNIRHFDFMGVGKPKQEYGVRDFKARFGGELVNYGRFTRINNRLLYGIAELGYNVLALFKKI